MKQLFSKSQRCLTGVGCLLLVGGLTANAAAQNSDQRKFFDGLIARYQNRPKTQEMRKTMGGDLERVNPGVTDDIHRSHLARSCMADQGEIQSMYRAVLLPIEASIRNVSTSGLTQYFTKAGSFDGVSEISSKVKDENSIGSMKQFVWDPSAKKGVVKDNSEEWVKSFATYLGKFSKIHDFRLDVVSYKAERALRNADTSMKEARLTVRMDLRGFGAQDTKARIQDSALANLLVTKTGGTWKIKEWKFLKGETLLGSAPAFSEVAANQSLVPEYERLEAIRRGGFALAVSDLDGDGIPDMYVGSHEQGRLLKGLGDGRFEPMKNKDIESVTRVKAAVFADFSGRGRQDLMLIRFATEHADSGTYSRSSASDMVLFENLGNGTFKKREDSAMRYLANYAMPATVADFDKDGQMDLYIGFPGVKDFTTVRGESDVPPAAVKAEGLFLNKNGKLVLQESSISKDRENYAKQKLYAHSALAVDLNNDSAMDILVIDDRGNLSPAYINDGNGNFVQANREIGFNNEGYGMGVAAGDLDGDGNLDLAVTNVTFQAQESLAVSCWNNWAFVQPMKNLNKALRVYRGNGKGKFSEETFAGLENFGDALGGVEFIDYNGDGLQDVYVVNGLWSGSDRSQEVGYLFDAYIKSIGDSSADTGHFEQTGTVSEMMSALRNFTGDVFDRKSKAKIRPSLGGFQRNRLFRNLGNGKFVEVGFLEGVDSIADGYVVAKADLNGDNVPDLVLRNADPGTSAVSFPPVQVFLNKNSEKNNFLKVVLQGVSSNRDAIGSKVSIQKEKKDQVAFLNGSAGTSQSEKTLFFGLGKTDAVDALRVTWPSGKDQLLKNIKAGKQVIQEPGLISGR